LTKNTTKQYRLNSADQLQELLSTLNEHSFVQHLINLKSKPPTFVLYRKNSYWQRCPSGPVVETTIFATYK